MSTRISMELSVMPGPTVARGGLRLLPPLRRSGTYARLERAQRDEPRHSFGPFALRTAPAPSALISVLSGALVLVVFGYFAFVCLTGWSGVSWL